jgi:exonuclease SbcD
MRVVICGDSHIGAVFGLGRLKKDGGNTRVDDYEKTLNDIVDYVIETKADVFVQTGDIFDSRNPTPENMAIVNEAFKRLSKNNITSIVIMGNHDYRKSGAGFTSSISSLSAKELPNVRIVLDPKVVRVSSEGKSVNIVLLPYRDKRMYAGATLGDRCSKYNEHISELIDSCDETTPIVVIGHNFFYEGSYNDYGGSEILVGKGIFDKCELVAMGHQHNFRVVRETGCPLVYTGSMEKLNFGDKNIDKFFLDFDTTTNKLSVKKINTRELCDESIDLSECDLSNISDEINNRLSGMALADRVVRVRVSVPEHMSSAVNKTYIEKSLYDNGAFYVSKISIEPIKKRLVRDTSILKHKDDLSIFKAFVESQSFDNLESSLILKKAEEVIG